MTHASSTAVARGSCTSRFFINPAGSLDNFSLSVMNKIWFLYLNNILTEGKNYLKNFIYSFLFLLNGMPGIDNKGANLLASGKG
jgi:hypothetical protein